MPAARKRRQTRKSVTLSVTDPIKSTTSQPVVQANEPSQPAPAPLSTVKTKKHRRHHRPSPPMVVVTAPTQPATPSSEPATTWSEASAAAQPVAAVPAKSAIPALTKTSYNASLLKRLSIGLGIVIVVGLLLAGWTWRRRLFADIPLIKKAPPYHLQVTAEKVNPSKAVQLTKDLQASSSANATSSPNLTPAYQATYDNYSLVDLHQLLNQEIATLKAEGQDTKTLASYLPKITSLEPTDPVKARDLLMEAVQLGKELQALYEYYRK